MDIMDYLKTRLIGEQLSSIEFVQDYLQLHFDGRYLIAYIWPKVSINGCQYAYGDLDYRNMLCELIGKIIHDIYIEEEKELKIIFDSASIVLNLNPNNPNIVSEIAIFQDTLDNSSYIFD